MTDRLIEVRIQGPDLVKGTGAPEDPALLPPRGVGPRVRWPEEPQGRGAAGGGEMHQAGVISNKETRRPEGSVKGDQVRLANQVNEARPGNDRPEGRQDAGVLGTAGDQEPAALQGAAGPEHLDGDLGEPLDGPGLADPVRSGTESEDRPLPGHQLGRPARCRLADVDVGCRRIVLEAQHPGGLDDLVDDRSGDPLVNGPLPTIEQAADGGSPEVHHKAPGLPPDRIPEPEPVPTVPGLLKGDQGLQARDVLEQGRGRRSGDDGEPGTRYFVGEPADQTRGQDGVANPRGGYEENRKDRRRHCR